MKTKRTVTIILFFILFAAGCARKAKPTSTQPVTAQPSATSVQAVTAPPSATSVPVVTPASTSVQPVIGLPVGTDELPWWNDTVFYEIFVRSFYDSDGDGIGDFKGLISKLDYLNDGDPKTTTDLGISGIWLMPINPSPSYHGYDVTDYYAVNPQYGTMEDFKTLLTEAHRRGIRVIIDLVINHTSSQHPWFIDSKDPNSAKRNWYIWSEYDPGYPGSWGQDVWYQSGKSFYYAMFSEGMPDLNFNNPEVRSQMKDVARFWLQDVGVDGFRLDAAKHIVEEGRTQENTPATHAWWKEFRTAYKVVNPQAMTIGEVASSETAVAAYLKGDELDMAFNFDLANLTVKDVYGGSARVLGRSIQSSAKAFPTGQYGMFLTNHDQNRVMDQLGKNLDKAKTAAAVMLTIPGVPFVYYGEEIGMTGSKPDERIRTPMQWAADKNAGFTTGSPWEQLNKDYATYTVADQTTNPDSLLSLYRTLIQLRNQHAALRVGSFTLVGSESPKVLAFLRQSKEETVLVIISLSKDPLTNYRLSLETGTLSGKYNVAPLMGEGQLTSPEINASGGFKDYLPLPELPAYGRIILQLQKK